MTVGWGIIGIGRHSDARMAPAIRASEHARLVAVYSRDLARARAFAAKHGAERAYSDLAAFLADPAVEAVYVGSPNYAHRDHVIACARAGKHILCDKPLALTVEDCERMIDAAEAAGEMLATGYNNRYQPAHRIVRELVQSGELGELVFLRADCASPPAQRPHDWRATAATGGGALLNIGTHALDLLRFVSGREVQLVAALDDTAIGGIDELAIASLRLDGGVFAQLLSSQRLPYPDNGLVIHATRGYLRTRGTISYEIAGQVEVMLPNGSRRYEFRPPRPGYDVYVAEIEYLSRALQEGEPPLATGQDGLEGVRLALAVLEAAAKRRVLTIDR
ncbi:MAG: Gfo/Idh/MocA family oxidoreductase [Chloroflexi bacterium]|nr:Gfo/Idh/MocA family oxidoreductase [Chloroflexota bacterium]